MMNKYEQALEYLATCNCNERKFTIEEFLAQLQTYAKRHNIEWSLYKYKDGDTKLLGGNMVMTVLPTPVLIESPYSGDIETNVKYAYQCLQHSYACKNEAPIATHLLYTKLSKDEPATGNSAWIADGVNELMGRDYALACGDALRKALGFCVFYEDLGWSSGMKHALDHCKKANIAYEIRTLHK